MGGDQPIFGGGFYLGDDAPPWILTCLPKRCLSPPKNSRPPKKSVVTKIKMSLK